MEPLNILNGANMKISATLLTLAGAVLIAGCASVGSSPPVKTAGGILTNPEGMTLYTYDKDSAGKSACNGPCAVNWPPLMTADGANGSGDYSVVTRDDGKKQWAYKGKPLYTWIKDQKAGDQTGDGFNNNVWHTAKP
jgi:predicted lipoprotein with Yx(FWY)xxD motif